MRNRFLLLLLRYNLLCCDGFGAGILGSARTCLHAVMWALCRGVDTRQGPSCIRSTPEFAELAYRLIYVLCADREMSTPVLRYLRTHDFLYRHARHLPLASRASGMNCVISSSLSSHGVAPWAQSHNECISSCPSPFCTRCQYPCCTSPLGRSSIFF